MNQSKSTARSPDTIDKTSQGFTEEERAAMKERAKELKAEARANRDRTEGESDVLAKIAEMPEAEAQYRNAIAADPKNADAMYNLGVLLYNQGERKEAEAQYRNAIAADPKNADAMLNLGVSFYANGKFKKAEAQYRKAIAVNPKDTDAMYNLGVLYYNLGKLKEAEAQYRNVIAADPTDVGLCRANLAEVLFDTNRKEEALLEAKTAQGLGVDEHQVFEKLGLKG